MNELFLSVPFPLDLSLPPSPRKASYAATDTDSYAGGLTGLVTGAGYATTVTSVYGGCAPALNAFASADGTGALAGGFNSLSRQKLYLCI